MPRGPLVNGAVYGCFGPNVFSLFFRSHCDLSEAGAQNVGKNGK